MKKTHAKKPLFVKRPGKQLFEVDYGSIEMSVFVTSDNTGLPYIGPLCIRTGEGRTALPVHGTKTAKHAVHELLRQGTPLPLVVTDVPPWKWKPKHKIVVC